MDDQFWLWAGLILTVVVGLPGAYVMGVLATLHSPRWSQYLQSRKLLKTQKTKEQALVVFNRIKAFREGKQDRYPFYMLLATSSILCAIFASTMILIISIQVHEYPISVEYAIVAALAVVAIASSLILLAAIYETARQIERFDDYKAEFERRWGSVDDEQP
jgi:multidrug transporter EmrE-like cation transporter